MTPTETVFRALFSFYGLTNSQSFPDGSFAGWRVSDDNAFSASFTYSPTPGTIIINTIGGPAK